jgi:hypothetical protein
VVWQGSAGDCRPYADQIANSLIQIAGPASEIVLKCPMKCEESRVWMFIFGVGINVGTIAKEPKYRLLFQCS